MTALPRFGIVDMGSNAIRMLVAEVSGSAIALLENHRLPIRTGREVFMSGQMPEATISAVVDAFRRFRASCDRLTVQTVRAIATAAMREARNRDLVVDRVRDAAGIEIEVVSGAQEAYLLAQGIQTRIDLRRGRSALVDVGGGSVQVALVEDGQVTTADSYRLGALRMLATLPDPQAAGESFVELLHQHLQGLERRIVDRFEGRRIDRYVAVGGNIECLADLLGAPARAGNGGVDSLLLTAVHQETLGLAELSYDDRMGKRGLKPDRADTIVPAGLVYARIGELAGVDTVLVPRVGIKDGLLAELVAGHGGAFTPEDHVDAVLSACRALGRRFHCEVEHAEAVLTLSRLIFDQTRELHGLGGRDRVLLEAAALLHDIGVTVNNDSHHKHSQYLIEACEIVGLADEERNIVALVARYHRKAPPSRDHDEFAALRRRERTLVERLAAILRLADALDRQHAGIVRSVRVRIADDRIEIQPVLADGQRSRLTLERRAVEEKATLFPQLYGKKLVVLPP